MKVLSAIYSQLGNAYFYLQQYEKAFEFHKHDLNLTRYEKILKLWYDSLHTKVHISYMHALCS